MTVSASSSASVAALDRCAAHTQKPSASAVPPWCPVIHRFLSASLHSLVLSLFPLSVSLSFSSVAGIPLQRMLVISWVWSHLRSTRDLFWSLSSHKQTLIRLGGRDRAKCLQIGRPVQVYLRLLASVISPFPSRITLFMPLSTARRPI